MAEGWWHTFGSLSVDDRMIRMHEMCIWRTFLRIFIVGLEIWSFVMMCECIFRSILVKNVNGFMLHLINFPNRETKECVNILLSRCLVTPPLSYHSSQVFFCRTLLVVWGAQIVVSTLYPQPRDHEGHSKSLSFHLLKLFMEDFVPVFAFHLLMQCLSYHRVHYAITDAPPC